MHFWDLATGPGPIVEQATHLVDLSRYFAPPPIISSVMVNTIQHTDSAGHLSQLHVEGEIPPERRLPRMTNAIWQYEGGAVGSILHGITIHGMCPPKFFELMKEMVNILVNW